MTVVQLVFYFFAALTVSSALFIFFTKNVLHAVLSLLAVFIGVSAMYVFAGADFLAIRLVQRGEARDGSPDDVTSVSSLALRLKLSRTQLGRKLAEAEAMGSLGWSRTRRKSPRWVSAEFRSEYHSAQAVKLAIIDSAFEACVVRDEPACRVAASA